MIKVKRILVYKDEGVGGKSYRAVIQAIKGMALENIEVSSIKACELMDRDGLKDASLLIVPGGRDLPYVERLKSQGQRTIRQWVEEGGAYFGICAGAYFGSASISFEKGTDLEITGNRDLRFFEGTAIGPAYGVNQFRYDTESGARAALVSTQRYSCYCYFNGGCTFKDVPDQIAVMARYEDIQGTPPAIIACTVGKGIAILSGVHPEFSHQALDRHNPYHNSIFPAIQSTESSRKKLFDSLIEKLLGVRRSCRPCGINPFPKVSCPVSQNIVDFSYPNHER